MKPLFAIAFLLFITGVLTSTIRREQDEEDTFEILILHNNDIHARFEQTSKLSSTCSKNDAAANKCYGGFARVANVVRAARKDAEDGVGPPVLYLNAGDTYTGTVWFIVYLWEIAAAFINVLKPDAVSLGNHEFDKGVTGLSPFIENLKCPVLCANIDVQKEPELAKETNLKKTTIFEIDGTKIGVIGYLTPDTKALVAPNQVEYEDEVVAIQREANILTNDGVNIIIALGHSGYETDKRIAREVEGIDVVVGGHTNTFLWNGDEPDIEVKDGPYPSIENQASGKQVPVVQAYAYTKYLGRLHLTFNSEGELIEHDGEPILLDASIPQEPDVLELLETFREGVDKLSEEVVGKTRVLIGHNISHRYCRIGECNLGNFVTDAMVYSYLLDFKDDSSWTDAPIAAMQAGAFKNSINTTEIGGNITRADVMDVLQYDNAIVAVTLRGEILLQVLEHSVSEYDDTDPPEAPPRFLHYSGIHVTYDLEKPPGSRVLSAYARCGKCSVPEYLMIKKDEEYKMLIPDYLFLGGDGYTMLKDNLTSSDILQFNDVDSVVNYLNDKSPVYPEIEGRIIFGKSGAVRNAASISVLLGFLQMFYLIKY